MDADLYDTKEEAIQAAIDMAEIGAKIVMCRGDWISCQDMETCQMCLRITVVEGLTAEQALAMARASLS